MPKFEYTQSSIPKRKGHIKSRYLLLANRWVLPRAQEYCAYTTRFQPGHPSKVPNPELFHVLGIQSKIEMRAQKSYHERPEITPLKTNANNAPRMTKARDGRRKGYSLNNDVDDTGAGGGGEYVLIGGGVGSLNTGGHSKSSNNCSTLSPSPSTSTSTTPPKKSVISASLNPLPLFSASISLPTHSPPPSTVHPLPRPYSFIGCSGPKGRSNRSDLTPGWEPIFGTS